MDLKFKFYIPIEIKQDRKNKNNLKIIFKLNEARKLRK